MRSAIHHRHSARGARLQAGRRQSSRSGFSLIHMVTVIGMMSILMTMSGVLIQSLLRSDQSVSRQGALEMTLLKLSHQFRDDVHAARELDLKQDNVVPTDSLELSASQSSRVTYRVVDETVIRESLNGNQRTGREVYRVPDCKVQFRSEANDGDQPRFLALDIDRPGLTMTPQQKSAMGKRNLTIVAELGRNLKIASHPINIASDAAAESSNSISVSNTARDVEIQP